MKILTTDSKLLLDWAEDVHGFRTDRLIKPICIGLVDYDTGDVSGAVIYDDFNGTDIKAHILSDGSKKWLTREFIFFMFDYPFNVLHADRITGFVNDDNVDALAFDLKLGFRVEGKLERAGGHKQDIIIVRMFRDECRFI